MKINDPTKIDSLDRIAVIALHYLHWVLNKCIASSPASTLSTIDEKPKIINYGIFWIIGVTKHESNICYRIAKHVNNNNNKTDGTNRNSDDGDGNNPDNADDNVDDP